MKIHILQIEDSENLIPTGISIFISKYSSLIDINYIKTKDENQIINWIQILSKDDIILCPIYHNPLPILNIVISKIREKYKKIKIYACGTLAMECPLESMDLIDIDDIVMSVGYPFLLLSDCIRKNKKNVQITNPFLKNIPGFKYQHNKYTGSLNVITGLNHQICNGKCSFCMYDDKKLDLISCNKASFLSIDQIISFVPEYDEEKHKNIKFIDIYYNNILAVLSIDEIDYLLEKIYSKFPFFQVNIYAHVSDIVKHNKNLIKISFDKKYDVNWRIGFESFSKSQLCRFNKFTYNQNIKALKFINSRPKGMVFEPLFLIFDPWVTPEEILTSYKFFNKINSSVIRCTMTGGVISSLINRCWTPISKTKLFEKAKNEKLLIESAFNEFGRIKLGKNERGLVENTWKFKNKKSAKIYRNLKKWNLFYTKEIISLNNDDISSCCTCCGIKSFHKKEYDEIESNIFKFIETINDKTAILIDNQFTDLKKMIEQEINE